MSNKKQTAVDWFFSELQRMQYFIGNDMLQAYKQAKEMEKQQIIETWFDGVTSWDSEKEVEDYIKQTYEDHN